MLIAVDMDGVLCDLLTPWLAWINEQTGEGLTRSDITQWSMSKQTVLGNSVYDYLKDPQHFADLMPMPGAVEGLKRLMYRHDVFLLTACAEESARIGKRAWVQKHINRKIEVVFSTEKYKHHADILLDDHSKNLALWRNRSICYDAPYNQNWMGERVTNWKEFNELIEGGN